MELKKKASPRPRLSELQVLLCLLLLLLLLSCGRRDCALQQGPEQAAAHADTRC